MPVSVAYHPPVPLPHQIQRVLRSMIACGEWAPEDRVPTEMALVDRFKVSRATIGEALAVLTRDGLIVRHRGRGTFVAPAARARVRPGIATNLLLGYDAEIRVVTAQTVAAPPHVPRGSPSRAAPPSSGSFASRSSTAPRSRSSCELHEAVSR